MLDPSYDRRLRRTLELAGGGSGVETTAGCGVIFNSGVSRSLRLFTPDSTQSNTACNVYRATVCTAP